MKLTIHVEGKNKAEFAQCLRAHLALFDDTEETDEVDMASLKKKATRKKPAPTVDDEEDEDFGTKPLKAKDLEEDEDTDTDESDEDEEPTITFAEVRALLNKYGEKYPDQARAILAGFNIKSPKELSATQNEKYWGPIFRKVMAKMKAAKKK